MTNYFKNTTDLIDKYNQVINKIRTSKNETTDEDDEFMINFCIYLAHALIKDYGDGGIARSELLRCAKIIKDVIEE